MQKFFVTHNNQFVKHSCPKLTTRTPAKTVSAYAKRTYNLNMKKIGIIFGGESVEHDVSIVTALQCYQMIKSNFDIKLIYITHDNEFYFVPSNVRPKDFVRLPKHAKRVKNLQFGVDTIINCCHGGIGENGQLSAMLLTLGIRYTNADCLSSMLAMDKSLTKLALKGTKVKTLPAKTYYSLPDKAELDKTAYPVIVKPRSLGSSIGVVRCDTADDLMRAIQADLMYDRACIVEKCIDPLIEYNCAVYQHGEDLIVSEIEQPVKHDTTLSFADKYLISAQKGMKGSSRILPAEIDDALRDKIHNWTLTAYKVLDLKGVVRVDYLFDPTTKSLYLNEINTIPGSLAFYLFEPLGISYVELIKDLIDDCQNSHITDNKITRFDSQILDIALHKN